MLINEHNINDNEVIRSMNTRKLNIVTDVATLVGGCV